MAKNKPTNTAPATTARGQRAPKGVLRRLLHEVRHHALAALREPHDRLHVPLCLRHKFLSFLLLLFLVALLVFILLLHAVVVVSLLHNGWKSVEDSAQLREEACGREGVLRERRAGKGDGREAVARACRGSRTRAAREQPAHRLRDRGHAPCRPHVLCCALGLCESRECRCDARWHARQPRARLVQRGECTDTVLALAAERRAESLEQRQARRLPRRLARTRSLHAPQCRHALLLVHLRPCLKFADALLQCCQRQEQLPLVLCRSVHPAASVPVAAALDAVTLGSKCLCSLQCCHSVALQSCQDLRIVSTYFILDFFLINTILSRW